MDKSSIKKRRRTAEYGTTLVYYDGPQVLTLNGRRDSLWICVAVEEESNYKYPIFCNQISREDFDRYITGHVDLRYLFIYSKMRDYRVADLGQRTTNGFYLVEKANPPADWFPDEGFFSRSHTEENVFEEKNSSRSVLTVDIDGQWDIPDFGIFSEKISQCYSFLYALNALGKPKDFPTARSNFNEIFARYPWKGGGSPLNFYNDLYGTLVADDRLAVKQIQYASPGQIDIQGKLAIFDEIKLVISSLTSNYSQALEGYSDLHHFLQKEKFLSVSKEMIRGTAEQQAIVSRHIEVLISAIGFVHKDEILEYADKNVMLAAKFLLSFFRRVNILFQFYAQGRAKFSG